MISIWEDNWKKMAKHLTVRREEKDIQELFYLN